MHSMTGFAEGKKIVADAALELTIKSVNHRALDIEISGDSLPLDSEDFLRGFCKQNLFRGKVRITFHLTRDPQKKRRVLNEAVLNDYLKLESELLQK